MNAARALAAAESLQELARKFTLTSFLPKFGKLLVCLLFLVNIRSWPLVWHFRVFRTFFLRRFQYRWVMLRGLFKSREQKLLLEDRWLDSITPVGANPFTMVVPFTSWASLDDSDFNGHLSNSSYAKTLDSARFKAAVYMFPRFFPPGGWMPLAATHYHFVREIPILAAYEVRTSVAAWDQKWLYVMSKFVRKTDGKKKKHEQKAPVSPPTDNETTSSKIMVLRTPGPEGISSTSTPFLSVTPSTTNVPEADIDKALNAVAAGLAGEEPDGATLHTVVISQLTPALVLGVNGFTGAAGHSHASPHPEWTNAKAEMSKPVGGGLRKLRALFSGGWRDVPEGERWWDQALGEAVEAKRVKNLSLIEGLRRGLENARSL
ncbi:hypothetical protein BDZ97DRAFT_1847636 [Flammula alnicola]|nr:hypothetical protein BDZ97DRAFT_1847636 [Flammula alnicola]